MEKNLKFIYLKKEPKLFTSDGELTDLHYNEKNHPYGVFPDNSQHWIKFHLTKKGNLKKVFYKKIELGKIAPTYYLKEGKQATTQKIILIQLNQFHQVEKQLTGGEKVFAKPKKASEINGK